MTDSQQQNDSFDMSEIMALAANKFGGVDYQTDGKEEEENATTSESTTPSGESANSSEKVHVEEATNSSAESTTKSTEPTAENQQAEVKAPEIDPLLKALLEANQPKADDVSKNDAETNTSQERVEKAPENKHEQSAQQQQTQTPAKALQPNDLIDDATRQMLVEFRDLDEQSFNAMDQIAGAHARANTLNLENAMVTVVQSLQNQITQQNQIIAQLQSQLSGVNTRLVAPTLEQDIEAMKNDPAVAAYLPYMQNVLNGNDSNAKMQLVNTWKQSRPQANNAAPATQAPVVERRTSNVSAAAEATAALANKTQSSMVQPTDEIKEGMELALKAFGPNR